MHTPAIPDRPFEEARRRIREERRRAAAERDAFEAFADRVRTVRPGGARAAPTWPAPLVDRTPDGGLVAVEDAYRETVMAVPHYEEEYGHGYAADVADELGPQVAAALTGTGSLDERTKRTVLLATAASRRSREVLLEALDAELASVDAAARRLRPVADELESLSRVDLESSSFGALDARRVRIDSLVDRCDVVAAARQTDLRDHPTATVGTGSVDSLPRYLYGGFDDAFPVLASVATLGVRMDDLRDAIVRAVSHYDGDDRSRTDPAGTPGSGPDGDDSPSPISR